MIRAGNNGEWWWVEVGGGGGVGVESDARPDLGLRWALQ